MTRATQTTMETKPDIAYYGLPGTGKTTALMDELEDELENGRSVTDITASTFRKRMATEFQERASEVIGSDLPDGHNLRTTHALAFHILGLSTDDVIDDEDRREVCDEVSVDFDGDGDFDEDADWVDFSGGSGMGAELYHLYSYCRNTRKVPDKAWRSVDSLRTDTRRQIGRTNGEIVTEFVETYENYKSDHDLIDFDDMLEACLEAELTPGSEVLIEDEFQDKSPLQIELFELWADDAERVIVAGDPYQAIYGFMGTDPDFMVEAYNRAEKSVLLDESYRFGPDCWNVATSILSRANYDVPEVKPLGETDVHKMGMGEYSTKARKVADDEALHLARCNYMLRDVASILGNAGIPFDSHRGPRWTDRQVALYNGVVKLRSVIEGVRESAFGAQPDYSNITIYEAKEIINSLKAAHQIGTKKHNLASIKKAIEYENPNNVDLREMIDFSSTADAVIGKNPFGNQALTTTGVGSESIRNRLTNMFKQQEGDTISGIDHELATIHTSKGQQAKHVFLLNGVSPRIAHNAYPMPANDRDEARVFFVGATRAADHLYLVEANETNKFRFPGV